MSLEQRLEKLEKRVERYRRATVVMALLLVAGVTMGQTAKNGNFNSLTCRGLRIEDDGGRRW